MFGLSQTEKLRTEVTELREAIERIEHACKKLEIEWAETYDKFRHLHFRVTKRVKIIEAAQAEEDSPQGEETRPGGEEPASGFSPSQLAAQAQVMARRSRKSNGREGA